MIDVNNINPVGTGAKIYMAVSAGLASAASTIREAVEATYNQGPVEKLVHGMEALYALIKVEGWADAATVQALGEAAYMVGVYNFHGKSARGYALYNAARRALGEEVPGDDPPVDDKFTSPPEPAPTA